MNLNLDSMNLNLDLMNLNSDFSNVPGYLWKNAGRI